MARAKIALLVPALLLAATLAASAQDASAPADDAAKASRPTVASKRARASSLATGSQGWWLGTAFMLLVLGGAGVVCIAARRQGAGGPSIKLQVVGRVALPPKHAVFAVRAGGRTLLIGAGPQGAPTLLGELEDEPVEDAPPPASHRPIPAQRRFDVRVGDES